MIELIARAIVLRSNRLLLARTVDACWQFLPGGHVEPGETIEEALVRELAEELGVVAAVGDLVGVVENRYTDDLGEHHELNLVFEVVLPDAPVASREPALAFGWYDLSAINVRPRSLHDALLRWTHDRVPFWRPA